MGEDIRLAISSAPPVQQPIRMISTSCANERTGLEQTECFGIAGKIDSGWKYSVK
jgi:hypothetical protein